MLVDVGDLCRAETGVHRDDDPSRCRDCLKSVGDERDVRTQNHHSVSRFNASTLESVGEVLHSLCPFREGERELSSRVDKGGMVGADRGRLEEEEDVE